MKKLFSTPKKAILTSICILCGILIIAAGAAFAASAVAKSKAIGGEVAELYALADAGIDPQDAAIGDTEFGYRNGQFAYEVEFTSNGKNYKYLINSKTGKVISRYSDNGNDSADNSLITLEEAKTIAFNDAGCAEADVALTKAELDRQDNVYDIEFVCGAMEYEYEIDAKSGSILESDIEPVDVTNSGDDALTPEYIGLARAKETALDDAGVKAEDVTYKKAKLDKDDGKAVYDIEFVTETKDYEYEIDAITGDIVKKDVENITGNGNGNDTDNTTQYIGVAKAKEIALNDAGVSASQATFTKAKLGTDDGMKIYDIEFQTLSYEYDYEINAVTGDIMDKDVEVAENGGNNGEDNTTQYIGVAKAKEIALKDAGVSQSQATFTKSKLDADDNVPVYELEFHTTANKYEYEIHATTGKIVDKSVEAIADDTNTGTDSVIGMAKAKEIALKDSGVSQSQATFTKTKLDEDDGVFVYDIEFYTSTTEYEYEINAKTGKIIDKSSEAIDENGNGSGSGSYIGVDKAKEIAVNHAGFAASDVTFRKAKLEHDDGRDVYEIEFLKNGVEYEYVIDARTGAILEHESEHDDD